jgi:hypothetical protein
MPKTPIRSAKFVTWLHKCDRERASWIPDTLYYQDDSADRRRVKGFGCPLPVSFVHLSRESACVWEFTSLETPQRPWKPRWEIRVLTPLCILTQPPPPSIPPYTLSLSIALSLSISLCLALSRILSRSLSRRSVSPLKTSSRHFLGKPHVGIDRVTLHSLVYQ